MIISERLFITSNILSFFGMNFMVYTLYTAAFHYDKMLNVGATNTRQLSKVVG